MRCLRVDLFLVMRLRLLKFTGSGLRCLLTFWIISFLPHATVSAASVDSMPSADSLDVWLQRVISAPERVNFEGTFVVGAGHQGSSSHIVHYGNGRTQLERVERLDGPERVVYRRDDEVVTLWPTERVLAFESRRVGKRFPSISREGSERVADHYSLSVLGTARIAGRTANVVSLTPKDAYRYGYRLWLDVATALPLRAEIVGAQQQVLEWAAFSDISVGVKPEPQRVLQGMNHREGWAIRQSVLADADLAYEGWVLGDLPAGFKLIRSVKRKGLPAVLAASDPASKGEAPILQLIFSDGLTYVSLFIEPYEAGAQRQNMLVSLGATQTLMVKRDNWWLIAIGDVPAVSLKAFLAALQHKKN